MKFLHLALALILSLTWAAHAQERATGSALETQMTWSALSTMVKDANARTSAVNTRVDQSIACNSKFMLYAPSVTGADTDGCIDNDLIYKIIACGKTGKTFNGTACVENPLIAQLIACGKKGQVFNGTTCIDADFPAQTPKKSCKFVYSASIGCPNAASCKVSRITLNETVQYSNIPTVWEHGEVHTWHYLNTANNHGGGQCNDGKITTFYTGW